MTRLAPVLFFAALCPALRSATIHATLTGFNAAETRVVEHVMDYWSSTILDPITVGVSVSKLDLAGDTLAATSGLAADAGGRPLSGIIQVDNRAGSVFGWFVDPTPALNEEYRPGATPWHRYGRAPGPAASDYDLMTVLHHEFAHLFGFSVFYPRFEAHVTPSVDYPPARDFTSATVTALLVPAYDGTHLSDALHPFDLMTAFQSRGERLIPSDLDLAMLSDVFGYSIANAAPEPVPEPATYLLTAAGLLLLRAFTGRARR